VKAAEDEAAVSWAEQESEQAGEQRAKGQGNKGRMQRQKAKGRTRPETVGRKQRLAEQRSESMNG
jgi:hypothetical protein